MRARARDGGGRLMTLPGSPRPPRSSLNRGGSSPASEDQLDAMRAAAWHRHGVASLAIHDITDPWLRQAVINEATRRWGRRRAGGHHGD
jgi:hypothetical protein